MWGVLVRLVLWLKCVYESINCRFNLDRWDEGNQLVAAPCVNIAVNYLSGATTETTSDGCDS